MMKENIVGITRKIEKETAEVTISVYIPQGCPASGEIFRRTYSGEVEYGLRRKYKLPYYSYRVKYHDRTGEHWVCGTSPEGVMHRMFKAISKDAKAFVVEVLKQQGIRGRVSWPIYGFVSDVFWVSLC